MGRVDAARNLARVPGRGAEATGRLFLAKRCHEAAKRGEDVIVRLPAILEDVLESLDDDSHAGAEAEADDIRRAFA